MAAAAAARDGRIVSTLPGRERRRALYVAGHSKGGERRAPEEAAVPILVNLV